MKKMQRGQPPHPQQSQSQHQPQSREWGLDAKFGDVDGLIGGRQQQPPRQPQHYPASGPGYSQGQRQQQPDGYSYSHQQPRQYEMQPRPPPTAPVALSTRIQRTTTSTARDRRSGASRTGRSNSARHWRRHRAMRATTVGASYPSVVRTSAGRDTPGFRCSSSNSNSRTNGVGRA
jgi:hypothetical protein